MGFFDIIPSQAERQRSSREKAELNKYVQEDRDRVQARKLRSKAEVEDAQAVYYKARAKKRKARKKATKGNVFGLSIRRKKQTGKLSRKSRIRLI